MSEKGRALTRFSQRSRRTVAAPARRQRRFFARLDAAGTPRGGHKSRCRGQPCSTGARPPRTSKNVHRALKVFYEEQHPETKAGKAGGLGKAARSVGGVNSQRPRISCIRMFVRIRDRRCCAGHKVFIEAIQLNQGRSPPRLRIKWSAGACRHILRQRSVGGSAGGKAGALGRCDRVQTTIGEVSFPSQPRKARSRMLRKHA
jgi:hypothetical protein